MMRAPGIKRLLQYFGELARLPAEDAAALAASRLLEEWRLAEEARRREQAAETERLERAQLAWLLNKYGAR